MTWTKGVSGNPGGRPKGARHKTTLLAEKLMAAEAEAIVRAVLTAAAAGDLTACRIVLDRIVPPVKERPVCVDMPEVSDAEGARMAQGAILRAVAAGELLPSEGATLAGIVEAQRRAIETDELRQRIERLEGIA